MISFLGGAWVSSAKPAEDLAKYDQITHFVVTADDDQLSRIIKLLTAISYAVNVVTISWLVDSFRANNFLVSTTICLTIS